jgi:tetratricopeptide (TPR) repeat protein
MEGYNEGNARPPFARSEEAPRFIQSDSGVGTLEGREETEKTGMGFSFDNVALWIVAALTFLLPIFFLPTGGLSLQATKSTLLIIGVLVALAFYISARMKERSVVVPLSLLFYAVWLIPLAYLLSTLFSEKANLTFLGDSFAIDSFGVIASAALLFALSALLVKKKKDAFIIFTALLGSGAVLALYHAIRLFAGPNALSFGVFTGSSSTPLGSWNGLAIFFGLITIFAMVALYSVKLQRTEKIIVGVVLTVSVLFLIIINFSLVWWAVGITALGAFVYSITANRASVPLPGIGAGQTGSGISFSSLIVLAVAVIVLFGGTTIGNVVNDAFGISHVAVRPSWQTTLDIARATLSEQAIFGSGPGTFSSEWLLHKPVEVNVTPFWNVDFSTGFGFIPTAVITTGVVGLLAFLVFLAFLLFVGVRTLVFRAASDSLNYSVSLLAFLGAVYLWVFAFLHPVSTPLLSLAFIMSGVFIGTLRLHNIGFLEKRISFVENPRMGFLVVLGLTVLFLGSIAGVFSVGERYIASYYLGKASSVFNIDGDIAGASERIDRSLTLYDSDQGRRLASSLALFELNQIAGETEGSQEDIRTRFQGALSRAISHAQAATELRPDNYQNWLVLAQVYQSVVPLKIEGAYENARKAYEEATKLNPQGPSLSLARAELEVSNGNISGAREYITAAIEKKGNYSQAIYLLAQIQINAGEVAEAARSVEATTIIDPNNPIAFFQLGVLRYSGSEFVGAVTALERALALSPDYANARYFLGLSYDRLGEKARAIAEFEQIERTNADNTHVKEVLENLRAGMSALGDPPQTPAEDVVDRDDLPLPSDENVE